MIPHLDTSTIEIHGRHFPACCIVCPNAPGQDDTEADRVIGGSSTVTKGPFAGHRTDQYMVPCENGILAVIEQDSDHPDVYALTIDARTCELNHTDPQGDLYLPYFVGLNDGLLVPESRHSVWYWIDAGPEWTVEWLHMISVKPFAQPPGPAVKLISLKQAEEYSRDLTHS